MKSKIQKKEELKKLKEKIPGSKIVVFTTFSRMGEKGLSVAQMTELRRMLKSLNSEYLVAKKTLMDLALHEFKSSKVSKFKDDGIDIFGIEGSVGLVFGPSDGRAGRDEPYTVAKKLYEFSKKNQALQFFGAFMDGNFLKKDRFIEMAKMPSRETLIARLLGMMMYPVAGLYLVLSEVAKKRASAS